MSMKPCPDVEGYGLAFPGLLAPQRFINGAGDAVGRLGGGQVPLCLYEHPRPLEDVPLVSRVGHRLYVAQVPEQADDGLAPIHCA